MRGVLHQAVAALKTDVDTGLRVERSPMRLVAGFLGMALPLLAAIAVLALGLGGGQ